MLSRNTKHALNGRANKPPWNVKSQMKDWYYMNDIELIKEWMRYAHNDILSAHHLFYDFIPKQSEISCYLSQQCAEKALKAYLLFRETEPPRIHDLRVLGQMCAQHDKTFENIASLCAFLTPFCISGRYPDELAPDEAMAKRAIDKAQQVYDFCASKIPEVEKWEQLPC
jgi:HEPN domain-containing protein